MGRDTGSGSGDLVELLGVEGDSERGLDSGAEGLGVAEDEDTGVVDLAAEWEQVSGLRNDVGETGTYALTKAVF